MVRNKKDSDDSESLDSQASWDRERSGTKKLEEEDVETPKVKRVNASKSAKKTIGEIGYNTARGVSDASENIAGGIAKGSVNAVKYGGGKAVGGLGSLASTSASLTKKVVTNPLGSIATIGNGVVGAGKYIGNSIKRNTFDLIQNKQDIANQTSTLLGRGVQGEDALDRSKWRWSGTSGFIFGFFLGLTASITFINYTFVWLKPGCQTVNGSLCNAPYGYCTDAGVCNCVSALVSGMFCEVSACTGGCQNGGICSPTLEIQNVADVCRWRNPTPQNQLRYYPYGWDYSECITLRQELNYKQFVLGLELTNEEAGTLPTCLCFGVWYGPDCSLNLAPQSADLKICSGYGNESVGFFENNTVGIGAQCNSRFQLADFSLSNTTIALLQLERPGILFEWFCGNNVTIYDDAFFIRASKQNWGCFCDEFHQGVACELGWCPFDSFGRTCSGNGAPNLGFGLEYNTSIKKHDACDLICTSGNVFCKEDGTCRKKCGVQNICPEETPYRCRDLTCAAFSASYAGQGEQGFLENVTARTIIINEPFTQLELTSPLVAMILPEGVNVSYYDTIYNTSFNFTSRQIINTLQPSVVTIIDDEYLQSEVTGQVTLIGLNGLRSLVQIQSETRVTLTNQSSTYFLLNTSSLFTALLQDGSGTVGIESCFAQYTLCQFTLNGSEYQPFTPNGSFIAQPFVIANLYVVLYGPLLSTDYPYSILDPSRQVPLSPPAYIFLEPGYFNVTIQYYVQEDLTLDDVCSPYQSVGIYFENSNNQSYFNQLWYGETYRQSSDFVAGLDFVVYFSFISNSWERGLYIGNVNVSLVQNIMKADIIEEFLSAKKISRSEHYGGGLVECPSYLFFYNNRCVWPSLINNNYNTTCNCFLSTCTCLDGSLVNTSLTIPNLCTLYANGVYFPIRWIYTEGNYTQEAQRFGGSVQYGNNITEVYYGNFSNLTLSLDQNWTIGGYYPLAWQITNFTIEASSNSSFTQYLNQTSFTNYWQAAYTDRAVFLNLTSTEKITSVIVHIRNNTLVVGNVSVLIPITLTTSSGQIVNITEIGQELLLDLNYPSEWVALEAPYPISVYEFNAWTNQRCNSSSTVTNITIWAIEVNTLNQSLTIEQTNASCLYETQPCILLNYTDLAYTSFFYTTTIQINTTTFKTNPNTCALRYSCDDGTCSNTPCVNYYNCKGDGYVYSF